MPCSGNFQNLLFSYRTIRNYHHKFRTLIVRFKLSIFIYLKDHYLVIFFKSNFYTPQNDLRPLFKPKVYKTTYAIIVLKLLENWLQPLKNIIGLTSRNPLFSRLFVLCLIISLPSKDIDLRKLPNFVSLSVSGNNSPSSFLAFDIDLNLYISNIFPSLPGLF